MPNEQLRKSALEFRADDREQFLDKIFGKSAREGIDVIRDGKLVHVPGYYDIYRNLSPERIDEIVVKNERKARESKTILFVGSILEGQLMRASLKERIVQEKDKDIKKVLKKEAKQVKKGLKRLRHIFP